jgi:hypothetical protein
MSLVPEIKKATSVKQHYRIVVDFDLDCPDINYKLVTHERKGLSKDLIGYSLSCQRLTVFSSRHPREARFRRKPESIKCYFESQDEDLDYQI